MKTVIFFLALTSVWFSDSEPITLQLQASQGRRFSYIILSWTMSEASGGYEIWRKRAGATNDTAVRIFTTTDYRMTMVYDYKVIQHKNYEYTILPKRGVIKQKVWVKGYSGGG